MKFYVIIKGTHDRPDDITTATLLKDACQKLNVEYQEIHSASLDLSQLEPLEPDSVLYKIAIDGKSSKIFHLLVKEDTHTVFRDLLTAVNKKSTSAIIHQKYGLPIIKTIFDLPTDRDKLARYAEALDGYPLIIKAVGGSHGVGVIKVESFESLVSIADYFNAKLPGENFILRKFINYQHHARLIVLGDKVVDSIRYKKPDKDFRTNTTDIQVEQFKFSDDVESASVRAVSLLGSSFGGVDVLIDETGRHHIAEVNVPCFFARSQQTTGVDIASLLVKYLMNKRT